MIGDVSPSPTIEVVARLFYTTPFSDYTVIEGLLLLGLIAGFIWLCVHFFRGGF